MREFKTHTLQIWCGLIWAATMACPMGLAAQHDTLLVPGVRVRVTTPETKLIGRLTSFDDASITILRDNGTAARLSAEDALVDISTAPGMCSPRGRSTCVLVGALAGAAVGFGAGEIAEAACRYCAGKVSPWTLLGGAVAGAVVGSVIGGEHWRRVEFPVQVTAIPVPAGPARSRPAVRVAVHLGF